MIKVKKVMKRETTICPGCGQKVLCKKPNGTQKHVATTVCDDCVPWEVSKGNCFAQPKTDIERGDKQKDEKP